jgi:hypothetical protein
MKTTVRLSVWTLFVTLILARASSAQPAQPAQPSPDAAPPATAPPADSGQPAETAKPVAASPTLPLPPPTKPAGVKGVEWTTLRLLHDKGVLSDAEFESALKDIQQTGAADSVTVVTGKVKTTIYGFTEADYKYESTQSCADVCGGTQIAKSGSYRGNHGRTIFGPRNSRIGLRFMGPEEHGIRVSGSLETDFFGPTATTDQGTYVNPVLRVRTSYVKLETPVVDFLIGQNWTLYGWQPFNLVESSQLPGLPGQMFDRAVQLKVSKTIKTDAVTAEIAAAALRPPQQDSATPDFNAGVRVQFNHWTGLHDIYQVFSAIQPAWIGVSGDLRQLRIPELSTTPHHGIPLTGGGISFNAYLPIIPATTKSRDNALAIQGEFDIASGTADEFTALGAVGTANAPVPPATPGGAATPYTANFDPGLAAIDASGHAELIKWTNYLVDLQYCPPGLDGRVSLFTNYGHQASSNAKNVGTAAVGTPTAIAAAQARIRDHEDFYEGGLSFNPTSSTRIAGSFSVYDDTYADKISAKNYSVFLGGWLLY